MACTLPRHGVVSAMLLHAGGQQRVWRLAAIGSKVARSGNRVWVRRPAGDGGVVVRYWGGPRVTVLAMHRYSWPVTAWVPERATWR